MRSQSFRAGFTLIELVTVIVILGILVGMLMPAVMSAREASRRLQCENNLRQVTISLRTHIGTHQRIPANIPNPWTIEPVRLMSPTLLLTANNGAGSEPQTDWDLSTMAFEPISYFLCPSAMRVTVDGRAISNYGLNHMLPDKRLEHFRDGTSQTLLICEIPSELASLWTWGPLADVTNINSEHADLVSISMADGSVRTLAKTLDPKTLQQLFDPKDGQILDLRD